MKQYEITNNGKFIGTVNVHKENIKDNIKNSIIETTTNMSYKYNNNSQTYELTFVVNDVDELYDIVSKYIYENDKIFQTIEEIKKYNNISSIKKNTKISIILPEKYLSNFNKTKSDIDLNSLLNSKIHFVKQILQNNNLNNITTNINNIINEYNSYINSNEYEFYTDIEKEEKVRTFITSVDKLIFNIEENTNYKYGENYIIPIKIKNELTNR